MRLTSAHKFAIGIVAVVILLFLAGTLLNKAKMSREPAPKSQAPGQAAVGQPARRRAELPTGRSEAPPLMRPQPPRTGTQAPNFQT